MVTFTAAVFIGCLPVVCGTQSTVGLTIDVGTVAQEVAPNFLGVNIDSASLYNDKVTGQTRGRLDFTNPELNKVAKIFAAAGSSGNQSDRTVLRIGGGSAESVGWGEGE